MKNALFGYTGFVGSNLDSQIEFSHKYNSSNAQDSFGIEFERVYFSAARAEKWKINQNPSEDESHISYLKKILSGIQTKQLILISTVDVFKDPIAVYESTPLQLEGLHAYGSHRAELEKFVQETFEKSLTVRLPGLFGPGLKKNVIFDLLHNNNIDSINPQGVIQYYGVPQLSKDIEIALDHDLSLIHLTSEPILTQTIAEEIFGVTLSPMTDTTSKNPNYDMRTNYSALYGNTGNYTYSAENQLEAISKFVTQEVSSK